jgi:high-affinity Fe2+/Pb2+ permease
MCGGFMINVNKWIGYISISIVMIMGIVIVSGMVGQFETTTRILIGVGVLIYVLLRILFMVSSRRHKPEPGSFSAREILEKGENTDPNNT